MNGQEIRDRLLHSYERSYDIVKPSEVNGHTYDACASYTRAAQNTCSQRKQSCGGSAVMSMRILKRWKN